jgi:hypothetical protein
MKIEFNGKTIPDWVVGVICAIIAFVVMTLLDWP